MTRLLLLVSLLALLLNKGSALNCWVCSSDTDPDCADPFFNVSARTLSECTPREGFKPICKIMRIKVNTLEDVTYRSCDLVPRGSPDNVICLFPKLPDHSSVEKCFSCHSDACNGGSLVTATSTTFIILTLAVVTVIGNVM